MHSKVLTLDQCRQMALEHNQKVLIANEQVEAAGGFKALGTNPVPAKY